MVRKSLFLREGTWKSVPVTWMYTLASISERSEHKSTVAHPTPSADSSGAHLCETESLPRAALHVLSSAASAWSPWWTRTCTARSSACQSSWSTAAGRPGARSGGSLCSGRAWSEGSRHPLHSDRSYSGRKVVLRRRATRQGRRRFSGRSVRPRKMFRKKHHKMTISTKTHKHKRKQLLQTKTF